MMFSFVETIMLFYVQLSNISVETNLIASVVIKCE